MPEPIENGNPQAANQPAAPIGEVPKPAPGYAIDPLKKVGEREKETKQKLEEDKAKMELGTTNSCHRPW